MPIKSIQEDIIFYDIQERIKAREKNIFLVYCSRQTFYIYRCILKQLMTH